MVFRWLVGFLVLFCLLMILNCLERFIGVMWSVRFVRVLVLMVVCCVCFGVVSSSVMLNVIWFVSRVVKVELWIGCVRFLQVNMLMVLWVGFGVWIFV